jgi:integrase
LKCARRILAPTTFREQAAWFIDNAKHRNKNPIKPATAASYGSCLKNHLNPFLGDMPLADVGNTAIRELVKRLVAANLAPKSIVEIVAVAKLVVSSAVNDNGDELYPRKWNHDFIDMPEVNPRKQKTPRIEAEALNKLIQNAQAGRYRTLFTLLAGTGLRIGEALAIRLEGYSEDHTTLSEDCRIIHVRKSVWRGVEQEPKTENAIRDVDMPEALAAILREFRGDRREGWLFQTRSGRPLAQRNIFRDSLQDLGVSGFHTFRRFRATHLEGCKVPWKLLKFWMGHSDNDITSHYAGPSNAKIRREEAEKAGLGFICDPVVTQKPQTSQIHMVENAA